MLVDPTHRCEAARSTFRQADRASRRLRCCTLPNLQTADLSLSSDNLRCARKSTGNISHADRGPSPAVGSRYTDFIERPFRDIPLQSFDEGNRRDIVFDLHEHVKRTVL